MHRCVQVYFMDLYIFRYGYLAKKFGFIPKLYRDKFFLIHIHER